MVKWICALLVWQASALFFTLVPGRERCIGINVEEKVEFTGAYVFTGENEQNMIARVKSPEGFILHQSPRWAREDNFEKIVSFDLSRKDEKIDSSVVTDSELEPLSQGLGLMGKKFDIIYRNIHFYQLRERTHRDLTERTCDRILWSAIGKMGILGVICLVQIYILKTLFSSKSAQSV